MLCPTVVDMQLFASDSWWEEEIIQREMPLKVELESRIQRILGRNSGKHLIHAITCWVNVSVLCIKFPVVCNYEKKNMIRPQQLVPLKMFWRKNRKT